METIDVIKELCEKNNMSVSQLETRLDFGNGSIAKSKNMSADRVYQISQYFNVPMEYILTGKTVEGTESEISLLRQQQSILIEINKVNNEILSYYKKIDECQAKLTGLKKEYSKIEAKKGNGEPPVENPDTPAEDNGWVWEDEFPFK